ncbi:MAG: hypothetical protein CVT63_00145 [Candidatus Anoxymicrobium japonicum]|uniref:Glycosyltransferase RgtA/B/C/D-like domain-containing protein n=1 Tax=Candidatus Anoxymicrobium japonicum TaxID=2013648 RepID=A0A2N3G8F3_9ACTN|nr:MAG: hypothetical protein CVT63_00145 [Candidatus Anoxymicrobium japonicum]
MQPVNILKILMVSPVLFFFPGAALIMYVRDRFEVDLLVFEIVALSTGASLMLTLLIGFLLVELSVYTLTRLAALMVLVTVVFAALWLAKKKGIRPHAAMVFQHGWFQIGVLAVMILASALFIGRWEAVLTERDVSPYLVEGVNIADHGRVFLKNETLSKLTPDEAGMLYGPPAVRGEREYLAGFGIKDQKSGTIYTRYFPLFSVLIAIAYRLLGLRWMLTLMNPCFALLSLLIIMLLVRRLLDARTAVLSGLALSLIPLSVWFARYPIPEMFTQLLVFLGLFFLVLYYPKGSGYAGLLAALAFGLAFTARFELYPIMAPLFAILVVFIIDSIRKKRSVLYFLWFAIPMGILLAHSLYSQKRFSGSYMTELGAHSVRSYMNSPVIRGSIAALAFMAAVCVILLLSKRARASVAHPLQFLKRAWRPIVAALVTLVSLYGYIIRPVMAKGQLALPAATNFGSRLPQTFVRMSWYFTHIGIILFILGLALFVLYRLRVKTVPLFVISCFFTALFFWNIACNPLHFFALRRLMPVVIPFMAIMIAYAVVKVPDVFKRRLVRRAVGALAVGALAVTLVFTSLYTAKLYPIVQYDGALKSMNDLNALIGGPNTAAVFYGRYSMVYYTDIMRYIYGIHAVPLVGAAGDAPTFDNIYEKLAAGGHKVYLVGFGDGVPAAVSNLFLRPVGAVPVSFKVLQQEYDLAPKKTVPFGFTLAVYQATAKPTAEQCSVKIGGADTLCVIDGFYPSEQGTCRWSKGTASFKMPNVETKNNLTLSLDISTGSRPLSTEEKVPVAVYAQDKLIGTLAVNSGAFVPYAITFDKASLPDPGTKEIKFRIEVPTWAPNQVFGKKSNDVRQLGVAISRIALGPVP